MLHYYCKFVIYIKPQIFYIYILLLLLLLLSDLGNARVNIEAMLCIETITLYI